MSTVSRTWLAGLALCASALALSSDAEPQFLGTRAMVALLVVFMHAWTIAVGERACPARGGVDIPRFAIGPRLLTIRPGVIPQCLVPVMLLGVATRSPLVLGLGVAVVFVLATDVLRQSLLWTVPAVAAVMGLLTMNEFHTLGDLLVTAQSWIQSLVTVGCWVLVLAGPLLRTDVAALRPRGHLVASLAALPGYLGAVWVMTRTGFAGTQPDLLGVAVVLLAGGTFQTVVVGFLAQTAGVKPRIASDFAKVKAGSVGMALMPMLLVPTALLGMLVVSMGERGEELAVRPVWTGLMALCLMVPLVPAAALVAAGLDRIEGRPGAVRNRHIALGALGAWLFAGPMALTWMFAPDGPMASVYASFTPVGGWQPITAQGGGSSFLLGSAFGGNLMLFGVPAADMCRAATLLAGTTALLAGGLTRHAACGLKGASWGTLGVTLGLQVLGIVFLQPRVGPGGAAVATAAACLVMLLVDARAGEELEDGEEEAVCEFDGLLDPAVAGDLDATVEEDPDDSIIGLSVEPAPQIVPDRVPAGGRVDLDDEDVDWDAEDAFEDAEIPDPFAESFRGKKGTPIAPEPEPEVVEDVDDEFAIDQLPDDPFFTPPAATGPAATAPPPVPPPAPDGERETEDDDEPAGVRL